MNGQSPFILSKKERFFGAAGGLGEASRGCVFAGEKGSVAALWNWPTNGRLSIPVGRGPYALHNFFGEPLAVTPNDKGEIEGVKYGQLTTVLVNAVKEQQEQIAAQQQLIEQQQQRLKQQHDTLQALKRIVCRKNRHVEVCK